MLGRPWVVELFHWPQYSPIGNALGVPLVATYCTPRCLPIGQRRFSMFQPGMRYPFVSYNLEQPAAIAAASTSK
jgi:hypothetical protein